MKRNIDLFGFFTSGLCALHCMALPILLSVGLISSISAYSHNYIEMGILSVTFLLAGVSLINGLKSHNKFLPIGVFIFGFGLIVLGWFSGNTIGHSIMAVGGILVAFGHAINLKYQRTYSLG